ncbi:MAG: AI-2E family transporter [Verrucomicrobiota bacterium]
MSKSEKKPEVEEPEIEEQSESEEQLQEEETVEEQAYPTRFQRKMGWMAITSISVVIIVAVAILGIVALNWTLGFLQPILVPIAVAGILAYLLEPVILWLCKRGWKHKAAVLTVFVGFNIIAAVLIIFVVAKAVDQAIQISQPDSIASISKSIGEFSTKQLTNFEEKYSGFREARIWLTDGEGLAWAKENLTPESDQLVNHVTGSLGKLFSFFGYIFGLILVPVYLYYFLTNSTAIADKWADYLPLWESEFKAEVVEVLKEINGYIISYFRGQMVVSLIDGALVAIALWIMGLEYVILIGVFLAILGLIPYVGNLLVLIPAVLIAIAQFSGEPNAWIYPVIVIAIFLILQQINGLVTAPKIVGDSVGLHPLTVIFSMLFWALLLGGVLGALLAVPLTASIKVLFQRYVWKTRIKPTMKEKLNLKEEPAE